jgi:hypothetical protein
MIAGTLWRAHYKRRITRLSPGNETRKQADEQESSTSSDVLFNTPALGHYRVEGNGLVHSGLIGYSPSSVSARLVLLNQGPERWRAPKLLTHTLPIAQIEDGTVGSISCLLLSGPVRQV